MIVNVAIFSFVPDMESVPHCVVCISCYVPAFSASLGLVFDMVLSSLSFLFCFHLSYMYCLLLFPILIFILYACMIFDVVVFA